MFGIAKISPLLLRIILPHLWYLGAPEAFERFQRKYFSWSHFSINHYSKQSVSNLTKRTTLPPVASGEIFENGWFSKAVSEL